jgi:hypothetical protein
MVKPPDWYNDLDTSRWPPAAKAAYSIMAAVAERRMARQIAEAKAQADQTQTPAPAA